MDRIAILITAAAGITGIALAAAPSVLTWLRQRRTR